MKNNQSLKKCIRIKPKSDVFLPSLKQQQIKQPLIKPKVFNIKIISSKRLDTQHRKPPIKKKKRQTQIHQLTSEIKCQMCYQAVQKFYSLYQCNHQFCLKCHVSYIEYQINQNQLLRCPKQNCNVKYNNIRCVGILRTVNRNDLIFKLEKLMINYNFKIYQCRICFRQYDVTGQSFAICCNYRMCFKCNNHHKKNEPCNQSKLINVLSNIEKPCICPQCLQIYQKDDKCNHVNCMNCKIDFCALCSALRNPIINHDNSYHRSDCPHYTKCNELIQKNSKCQLCQQNNCSPPKVTYNQFIRTSFQGRQTLIEQILWRSPLMHM